MVGSRWMARLASFLDRRYGVPIAVALFSALVFIPYLGAVGLWDPWETHYSEVGRMMIQRNDYVHPYWENAYFYSKPALTMWIQALGMQLTGTNRTPGAVSVYTEWGVRLPFVLMSILGMALLSLAIARVVNKRVALAAGFVLSTMPLYFLLTRQAVTDTPFLSMMMCAMACAIIGQLDETTRNRTAWWYGFYVFCALSTLAKGLMGFGVPAVVLLFYALFCVVPWNRPTLEDHLSWPVKSAAALRLIQPVPVLWRQLFAMKLGTGILVFLAIAAPWYAVMFAFPGLDDEGKQFWWRFLIQDHLNRLAVGVHTTTPGGTFTYFIEQGGYAIFPWVGLLPGALAVISRLRFRSINKADHLMVIAAIWAIFSFFLVAISATKFHHYIFPALPGLAILVAAFIDQLWEEGVVAHAGSLILGCVLFVLVGKDLSSNPKNFTDLFVYNYSRTYPVDLVQRNLSLFHQRTLWAGDVWGGALMLGGAYLLFEAWMDKARPVVFRCMAILITAAGLAISISLGSKGTISPAKLLGAACLASAAYAEFYVLRDSRRVPGERAGLVGFSVLSAGLGIALFIAGFASRVDPLLSLLIDPMNTKAALGAAFAVGGTLASIAALLRARVLLFTSFAGLALGFALWFNWGHWVDLSHHWTQRDLFWRYYGQRHADEPIAAFYMNWRGETFYSRNTVKQIKDSARMTQYASLPGRKWALVEHDRLQLLKSAVGADKSVTPIDKDLNVKFVLVTIE